MAEHKSKILSQLSTTYEEAFVAIKHRCQTRLKLKECYDMDCLNCEMTVAMRALQFKMSNPSPTDALRELSNRIEDREAYCTIRLSHGTLNYLINILTSASMAEENKE